MTQLTIQLSEDMDATVRARAAEEGYADPQEYVRALILADAADIKHLEASAPAHLSPRNQSDLERLLIEGLDSGPAEEITAAQWAEKRRQLRDRSHFTWRA